MNNSAIITPTLAAGSTSSPYSWQINISQKLCHTSCISSQPIFNPSFQVVGVSNVGTNQYMVTLLVQGNISYVPCNSNSCCTKSQIISQQFSLPVYSTTAITSATLETGTPINAIVGNSYQNCSKQFVSEIPISVTIA